MADLLTNIALKALKPAGEIQPRLRTRFEPSPTRIDPIAPSLRDLVPEDAPFHPRQADHSVKPVSEPKTGPATIRKPAVKPAIENSETRVSRHPTVGLPKLEATEKPAAAKARPIDVDGDLKSPPKQVAARRATIVPKTIPNRDSRASAVHFRKDASDIQVKSERREPDAIHITIGRVEVRAIVESGPRPQRQTSKPTVMTLDEYLTRRAKGGAS